MLGCQDLQHARVLYRDTGTKARKHACGHVQVQAEGIDVTGTGTATSGENKVHAIVFRRDQFLDNRVNRFTAPIHNTLSPNLDHPDIRQNRNGIACRKFLALFMAGK